MEHLNNSADILRKANLRATSPRRAVLSYLGKEGRPLSIKEIKRQFPRIDLATLYRMMETFEKARVVIRVNLGGNYACFELKSVSDHHHIVCTNCNRIEDFADKVHEKIASRVLKHSRSFTELTGHSFELYGLCNTCVAHS